jgi:tetratricopeptide (TPR) repeat protein
MKSTLPPNTLVEPLTRQFFLGRSSAYLAERHAVLHVARYREFLAGLPAKPEPEQLAARGRILRVLGEKTAAAADLDAAIAGAPELAAARAWRWELRAGSGRHGSEDLEQAIRLEPGNGWWRLWLAIARESEGKREAAIDEARAAAELLPAAALPRAVEGLILFQQQRHADALAPLDAALLLEPGLEWVWRLRGMCRYESGDRAGCLADCIEAMKLDENSGLLFVMLGLHKLKTDIRRNVELSTRHIERHPDEFWAYVFRADNRRSPEIGENLGAIEDLRRAAELEPRHGWVWAYLSRCQVTLGDFRAAGESMARAVELDPDCGWVQAWRGEFMRRAGDARGAAKALDLAVKLFPDYELAYAWRGSARRQLGKPEAALEDLNIAIGLKPHTLDLCYFERMQTYRALGRVAEALEDIQRASALNPKYAWEAEAKRFGAGLAELDAEIRRAPGGALAHLWRGDIMMRLRDFARAEADLSRALACAECPPEALILRGRVRFELKKWKPAFADLDKAVALGPESAFAYAWRGRARMLRGRYAAAIADFERALELETNSAWILGWKGEAEFRLKRWAKAEDSLTRAIQVHVRFADAFLWRGAARLRRGDRDGSWADLSQALTLQPGNALALCWRGLLLLKNGRVDEARADIDMALADPGLLTPAELRELKAARLKLRAAPPARKAPIAAEEVERGRTLQGEGRHAEAADLYTRLIAKSRRDVGLRRLRAEAYRCLGRYDLALHDQVVMAELQPRSAAALASRVETRRHLGDFAGGLADADAAIALDPASASAWAARSECLRSLGRYDEAIESASTAMRRDPDWSWAPIVRAKALRQKGDLEAALADTRLAEKTRTESYARGWRAEILRKSGRLEEALADILVAATMQPTNAWFLALRAQIQCELGAHEKGLADLQEAMRLDPRCSCDYDFLGSEGPLVVRDDKLAWVYALRGGVRRAADRLKEARADLDRALKLAPDCFWILAWHGEILVALGETEAGLGEIRRALKIYPRYAQAWIWAGQALLKEERTAEASKAYASALGVEPNNVWGLIGRAVCLEKIGKSAEAAALFARAQALAPALFAGAKAA